MNIMLDFDEKTLGRILSYGIVAMVDNVYNSNTESLPPIEPAKEDRTNWED